MPTKTSKPKTFLGVPLMRIFWLFIYSVVLCLLVGIGVWYFTQLNVMHMGEEKAKAPTTSNSETPENINPKVSFESTNAGYEIEAGYEELKLKLITALENWDLDSLISLNISKDYDCVGEQTESLYGPMLAGKINLACDDAGYVLTSPPQQVKLYEVGCFRCGPGLVGRTGFYNILNSHSLDNNYTLVKYGPAPTDLPFYYLFKNTLGDYILITTRGENNILITPVSSNYSESEIIGNLPTY